MLRRIDEMMNANVQAEIDRVADRPRPMIPKDRHAFCGCSNKTHVVIRTHERFHGCFAFRKGVIPPDGA